MKLIRYSIIGWVLLFMILGNSFLLSGQETSLVFATCASEEVQNLLDEHSGEGAILGQYSREDTVEVLVHLREAQNTGRLPSDLWFAFGKADKDNHCSLYALHAEKSGYSPKKEELQSVELIQEQSPGGYSLILTFNGKGARQWARMTGDHVGEYIAIVVDGKVVSAPRVMSAINGGKCMITGEFTYKEALGLKSSLGF